MNIQQLEYIVAVDEFRHFVRAAEKCCVTQPTLSMMLQKLEDELGVKIFDRSKQPIEPTPDGKEVIKRAKSILGEINRLKEYTSQLTDDVSGVIRLAVIPTLAPYIVPLFIQPLMETYPKLNLIIKEMNTSSIIECLKTSQVDIGLLATPLNEPLLEEYPLFYEEFLAYTSVSMPTTDKEYLLPSEIDISHLWLLEEGHCFRSQVLNFCELKKKEIPENRLQYEAGSIETLVNLVDTNNGVTIVPLLATLKFTSEQKNRLRQFKVPKPVREISLVINKNFSRTKILQALKDEIMKYVSVQSEKNKLIVKI
jgi:LysR family transcriptional regulator, hydrogen peroxide-inducible genes activator